MAESKPPSKDKCGPVEEDDVWKLNLKECRNALKEMGLSLTGFTELKPALLFLKTEIIKRKSGRSKDKRKLAVILKKYKEDHKRKCDRLIALLDSIETKIDSVPKTDPLWKQLDIICKDYKEIFENQRIELKKTLCKLLVTGETCAGKTTVINNLLGDTLLPESFLCNTQALSEISYGKVNSAIAYLWDDGEPLVIAAEEGKDFLEVLKEKIEARDDLDSHGVFKRIEIHLNNEFLMESEVTIIDTPGVGDNAKTTKMVYEHIKDAFGFLFVINTENRGGANDRIHDLLREVTSLKIEDRQFFRPESVVFLGNKWDMIPPSEHDRLSRDTIGKLSQFWPGFNPEQFLPYCANEAATILKEGYMTTPYCELLNRFEALIPVGTENKLRMNFGWIANMLRKVIFALDVHINNRQKDFKKKKKEFEATIERLSKLQEVTVKDFRAFKKSLNTVTDELVAKLKHFFLDEQVLASLAEWDEHEFRLVTDWQELEQKLYECLTSRLNSQMRKWDMEKKEFQHAMDKFQDEVQHRVSIIGKEIEDVLRDASNRGEPKGRVSSDEHETGLGWIRPFFNSMTTFQAAFLGYSVAVLFPVTAVIAVSAFIYLSSVKLLDVIRSYFKGHEFEKFKARPVEYLKKCSETLIKEYCKSKKGLRAQVVEMLGPWHEFVDRLTEIVPAQISKDKEMIRTYMFEESMDVQLNDQYPFRRKCLEAVQKALRHFEMFSLQRMSKDVPMFSLNDVAFDENEGCKICGGFNADIYHAALRILASKDEVDAMIQDGKKMMKVNLTSIAEMNKLISKDEEEDEVSPSPELEESFLSSEGNDDIDETDHDRRHVSFSGEGDLSYITDELFNAFKVTVDNLEKKGGKVMEVEQCCRQREERVTEVKAGLVAYGGGGGGENRVKEVEACSYDEKARPRKNTVPSDMTSSGGESQLQEEPEAEEAVGGGHSLMDQDKLPKIVTLMNKFRLDGPLSRSCEEDVVGCSRRWPLEISGKMGHISIRCLRRPILEKDIYHYLEEERSYSCHQCPNLVKFKGTCISENKIYHKLEPLKCSLRQFVTETLWSKPKGLSPGGSPPRDIKSLKVPVPADDPKYNMIKDWLLSILEGLVYLHAQELTSLNLSLDSIAVDANNVIKLTSISCPKRIIELEQFRAMTEDDLRSYRYIALEAFDQDPEKNKYTSKSDMYAFGLLMWEILLGKVVFEDDFNSKRIDLTTAEGFMKFISKRRPVSPISELCLSDSDFVNYLMKIQSKCWAFDANERITSEQCMGLVKTNPRPPPMPVARF